jgi:predicted RNA-binding Zn-ribbon protein involved in translation (DUF1610 family)
MALMDLLSVLTKVADDLIMTQQFHMKKNSMSLKELEGFQYAFLSRIDGATSREREELTKLIEEVNLLITNKLQTRCSDCSGTGKYMNHHDDEGKASCPYCGGLGIIRKAG